jgi:hypothetical protein
MKKFRRGGWKSNQTGWEQAKQNPGKGGTVGKQRVKGSKVKSRPNFLGRKIEFSSGQDI